MSAIHYLNPPAGAGVSVIQDSNGDYIQAVVVSDAAGNILPPATTALRNVAASTSSVSLAAANGLRRGGMVYNDSTANLYLKLGTGASTSSFTVKMPPGAYFELPQPIYVGAIEGAWDAADGNARVTEVGP